MFVVYNCVEKVERIVYHMKEVSFFGWVIYLKRVEWYDMLYLSGQAVFPCITSCLGGSRVNSQ